MTDRPRDRTSKKDPARGIRPWDRFHWPQGDNRPTYGSIVLILGTIAVLTSIQPTGTLYGSAPRFEVGDIASQDVIAKVDFRVEQDAAALLRARERARDEAPLVLAYQHTSEIKRRAVLDAFYVDVDGAVDESADSLGLALRWSFGLSHEDLARFGVHGGDEKRLRRVVDRAVEQFFDRGVVVDDARINERRLMLARGGVERPVDLDELVPAGNMTEAIGRRVAQLEPDPELARIAATLASAIVEPNVLLDEVASAVRAREAEERVPRVVIDVRAGEKIVGAHEVVTPEQAAKLRAYEAHAASLVRTRSFWTLTWDFIARMVIIGLVVGCMAVYVVRYRPDVVTSLRTQVLLAVLLVLVALPSAGVLRHPGLEDVLAPLTLGSVLCAILLDAHLAIMLSIVTCLVVSSYSLFPASLMVMGMLTSLGAVFALNNIRKRSAYYRSVMTVVGLAVLVVLLVDYVSDVPLDRSAIRMLCAAGSVVASFLFALFVLPPFERIFGVTTDLTLHEYADLNHPLLRRLAVEAPGTFHHSMMMANLAEAAATAIGANPLLARVGAYYHDIGKMPKADYFIENQGGGANKHDDLAPSMSALIIQSHVKDGIELGRKHRLPQAIIDFIPEHHGTSVVSYFYTKAVKSDTRSEVRMDDYRYSGPKPHRRETAIVMIADTVEAISRTLEEPTPARLESIVKDTINTKFAHGQMEDSGLTLKDLRQVAEAFHPILLGAFHGRVAYPETREDRFKAMEKEQARRVRGNRDDAAPEDEDAGSTSDDENAVLGDPTPDADKSHSTGEGES